MVHAIRCAGILHTAIPRGPISGAWVLGCLASGALPPGFPPVEIDGEHYWDGGLVSNTPLQYVLDQPGRMHRLVFQGSGLD